ncbi:MFS transporter [Nakamurella deserti]|uniref:MFS transporter n=1 Tax=Nakamurella deserti TaxID=2164074 RepID=UPI00197B7652|nr:MFS transporter [Nakamurella deserti]
MPSRTRRLPAPPPTHHAPVRPSGSSPVRRPPAAPPVPPVADTSPARRRLIFAIVAVALFMSAMDQSIVATALGSIQTDLGAGINWTGWTVTAYALGQVFVMPIAGRMSDQYGRKKIFLASAALFTGASLACGLAGNIYLLVLFRVLQAVGGGAFMPSATGIVADHFGADRDRAIGLFTSVFPIGGMVGPVVGSVIVSTWSWREIFLVNVPLGIALILLGWKFLPRSDVRRAGTTDVAGIALFSGILLAGMGAVTHLGSAAASVTDPLFLVLVAVAVLAAVGFLRHIRRHRTPVIPPRFLHGPGFGVINLLNFVYGAAALGFAVLVPVYVENRYGLDLLQAGSLLTGRAVGMIALAGLAVWALRRTGVRLPMTVGFLLVAAGLGGMALVPPGTASPFVWLAVLAVLTGVGTGLAVPAANNAGLQLAPESVAVIAGLRGMFRQAGAIVAVSVATAVMARAAVPAEALSTVFLVSAGLLVVAAVSVRMIPEHKGAW